MSDLTVIIPAFHRPHRIHRIVANVKDTAPQARLLFVVDMGDAVTHRACLGVKADMTVIAEESTTYAEKINWGLEETGTTHAFFGADDIVFHPGWYEAGMAFADDYAMVGTRDGLNLLVEHGLHATHWFAQTQYALDGGFNFDGLPGLSTAYRHNYVDNEAITVAASNGEFRPCLDSVVEHVHHLAAGGLPYDGVYKLGDESKTEDMLTFQRRLYAWLGGLNAQGRGVPGA